MRPMLSEKYLIVLCPFRGIGLPFLTKSRLILKVVFMKPTNEEIIKVLKGYDAYICAMYNSDSDTSEYKITQRTDVSADYCELVHVEYTTNEDGELCSSETTVLVYEDGTVFVTVDWSSYPVYEEQICDFDWICANNMREGILFNGLPRLFP